MFDNLIGSAAIVTLIAASLGTFVVNILKVVPKQIFNLIKDKYGYSLSCDSESSLDTYMNINNWMLNLNKRVLTNHINIRSYWSCGSEVQYFTLDYGTYIVFHEKTFIYISKQKSNSGNNGNRMNIDELSINIFGINGLKVKNTIQEYSVTKHVVEQRNLRVFSTDQYNEPKGILMEKRNFDTVFTPCKDVLIQHLDKWRANKDLYKQHGLAYKTGILLEGPPGTGKSSLAKVIASYMNYNLYVITDAASVKSIASRVKENSVLLIEDIDCTLDINRDEIDAKDKDNGIKYEEINGKAMLGNILNILDGVASPENVIFVITTNCLDKLDDALIRKGRIDLQLHIDNLQYKEAYAMCESFNIENPDEFMKDIIFPVNPSSLQEKILAFI